MSYTLNLFVCLCNLKWIKDETFRRPLATTCWKMERKKEEDELIFDTARWKPPEKQVYWTMAWRVKGKRKSWNCSQYNRHVSHIQIERAVNTLLFGTRPTDAREKIDFLSMVLCVCVCMCVLSLVISLSVCSLCQYPLASVCPMDRYTAPTSEWKQWA